MLLGQAGNRRSRLAAPSPTIPRFLGSRKEYQCGQFSSPSSQPSIYIRMWEVASQASVGHCLLGHL